MMWWERGRLRWATWRLKRALRRVGKVGMGAGRVTAEFAESAGGAGGDGEAGMGHTAEWYQRQLNVLGDQSVRQSELIADLLEALERALPFIRTNDLLSGGSAALTTARTAIAKAGERARAG